MTERVLGETIDSRVKDLPVGARASDPARLSDGAAWSTVVRELGDA
ncbi:MAG: hypothetical protein RBU30_03895 [Polyangia bacterium]|nr:hypothetical protein [Polyangia bacterium]